MPKVLSVQFLRAVACLLVLIEHFFPFPPVFNARINGTIGVDLFFVISGFIISGSIEKLKERPVLNFSVNRLARVVPYYFFLTFILILFNRFLFGQYHNNRQLLKSIFFYPQLYTDPCLPLGWSLNHEIFFYVFVSIALLFTKQVKYILLTFLLFISALWLIPAKLYIIEFLRASINYTFAAGMLIYIYKDTIFRKKTIMLSCLCVGLVMSVYLFFFTSDHQRDAVENVIRPATGYFRDTIYFTKLNLAVPRFLGQGIAAILLFVGVTSMEKHFKNQQNIFIKIGNASYSIYLVQIFFLVIVWRYFSYHTVIKAILFILTIASGFLFVKLERFIGEVSKKLMLSLTNNGK